MKPSDKVQPSDKIPRLLVEYKLGHSRLFIILVLISSLQVSSSCSSLSIPPSAPTTGGFPPIYPLSTSPDDGQTINVLSFGAKGDGFTNDSPAFLDAWKAVCKSTAVPSILEIPRGHNFSLNPISFQGPCNSATIQVLVNGNIVAPTRKLDWTNCESNSWIVFLGVNNLVVKGSGEVNGRGEIWWPIGNDTNSDSSSNRRLSTLHSDHYSYHDRKSFTDATVGQCVKPTALRIQDCEGFVLSGLTHRNSPGNHITIFRCSDSVVSNIQIIAPENSHNTDGIDISWSTKINILNSNIGTGDDCIAISSGSSWINVTGVNCGPGHGISIGSLGMNGQMQTVEEVYVNNCTFRGTQNGARIKTWQGGSGFARNIKFSNIPLMDVRNPIIIDQFYCNGRLGCKTMPSAVQVSNVTFMGIHGTIQPGTNMGIILNCSTTVPCTNILLDDINIYQVSGRGGRGGQPREGQKKKGNVVAYCSDAKVICSDLVQPRPVDCF